MRLNPNKSEARRHIEALSGDPNSVETFQVIYSKKNPTDDELLTLNFGRYRDGRIKAGTYRTGTLDQWWDWLVQANNRGCGIYILVNQGDGKGRKASNILRPRALFAEDDKGQQLDYSSLPPNLVIQSKKGQHCYWLLAPTEKLTDFSLAQQTVISHFDCDPACKDPSRVLRLASFYHVGDLLNPFEIKITHLNTARKHTMAEVMAIYPARQAIKTYNSTEEDLERYTVSLAGTSPEDRAAQAKAYIQKFPPLISGFGERANKTLILAARVYHEYGILSEVKTFELLKLWNKNSPDPWTDGELRGLIHNAAQFSGHATGKALIQNKSVVSEEAADWLETAFNSRGE